MLLAVGSLNRAEPHCPKADGIGISLFDVDPATGRVTAVCEERGIDNPTFLAAHPGSGCLYAVSEVSGWHEGTISAFRFDPAARRLVYLSKQPTLGNSPAHVSLGPNDGSVLVANYGGGAVGDGPDRAVATFPRRPDGSLGPAASSVVHRGSGADPARQDRSHPHCVIASPDGRFALVADLGLDAVLAYRLGEGGALSEDPVSRLSLPPGAGPRHLEFHPEGGLALLVCELDCSVALLGFEAAGGGLALLDTVATGAPRGTTHCSDIRIHPNGRFAYAGNRGQDDVAVIGIDAGAKRLVLEDNRPCGGRTPRHLMIDPSGRFLLVANQNSGAVAVLAVDPDDGRVSAPLFEIAVGTPMCTVVLDPGGRA